MNYLTPGLSTAVLLCGMAMSNDAAAATITRVDYLDPAMACQLSIPTTDTGVRPRATGYRNEGASPAFMICGLKSPSGGLMQFQIVLASFDGQDHVINCTGVSRSTVGGGAAYSTKAVNTSANGIGTIMTWFDDTDLELSIRDISVTCPIPPGVAILNIRVAYSEDIGA